jgi:hypothetical protein
MAAEGARTHGGSPGVQPGLTRRRGGGLRRRGTRPGIGDFGRRRERAGALLRRGGPGIRGGKPLDFALRSSGCVWACAPAPIPCRNPRWRSRNRRRISMPVRRPSMNPQWRSLASRRKRRNPRRRGRNFPRKKANPYRMLSPQRRRRRNRRGRPGSSAPLRLEARDRSQIFRK